MEQRRGIFRGEVEEGNVDLFGEVVAGLVEAVDVVLGFDDGVVGGVGVAGVVFAVPEVEVGAVLIEDELIEGGERLGSGGCGVVTVEVELVVEGDDVVGVEHEWRMQG